MIGGKAQSLDVRRRLRLAARGAAAGLGAALFIGFIGWAFTNEPCTDESSCLGFALFGLIAFPVLGTVALTALLALARVPGPLAAGVASVTLFVLTIRFWLAVGAVSALAGAACCTAVIVAANADGGWLRRWGLVGGLAVVAWAVATVT